PTSGNIVAMRRVDFLLPAMQISRLAAEDEGAADFGGPLIFAAYCAPREEPLGVSPMPDQRRGFFTPRNCRVGPESNVRFGSIAVSASENCPRVSKIIARRSSTSASQDWPLTA